MNPKNPLQPLLPDANGSPCFKPNAIVVYLLDNGPFDMNYLITQNFTDEDREQFAQLIGYPFSGFAELSYVSDETLDVAVKMAELNLTEAEARRALKT